MIYRLALGKMRFLRGGSISYYRMRAIDVPRYDDHSIFDPIDDIMKQSEVAEFFP